MKLYVVAKGVIGKGVVAKGVVRVGAFSQKHLASLTQIKELKLNCLAGGNPMRTLQKIETLPGLM